MNDGWDTNRPVYDRLPRQGYQDNEVVDWLTQWADDELMTVLDRVQNFYKEVDPTTAQKESLDFLAWLVGLSGDYWDVEWSESVKRSMISNAFQLWKIRGTQASILKVLEIHGIDSDLWQKSEIRLSFRLPARIGTSELRIILRLPLKYHRAGKEFREAQRTLRNFAPAVISSQVAYQRFYLGFSRLGEPMFKN